MSTLAEQMRQIASIKTLEEEIVEQLEKSDAPLRPYQLMSRVSSTADRGVLVRELARLAEAGTIVRTGERNAAYALPKRCTQPIGSNSVEEAIMAKVRGRAPADALLRKELLAQCRQAGAVNTIIKALRKMVNAGTVCEIGNTRNRRYHDPAVETPVTTADRKASEADKLRDAAVSVAHIAAHSSETSARIDVGKLQAEIRATDYSPPQRVEFAIHSDGQLDIIGSIGTLVLVPDDTRRLKRFLDSFNPASWGIKNALDTFSAVCEQVKR